MSGRNIDVIIHNLELLKEQYQDYSEDEFWWEDEYGADLLHGIDCHPIFSGDTCLNDVRDVEYGQKGWTDNCDECKAKWLFEKFE